MMMMMVMMVMMVLMDGGDGNDVMEVKSKVPDMHTSARPHVISYIPVQSSWESCVAFP